MAAAMQKFPWLETLKNARKTNLVQDGKRKVHYTFPDHTEMVEEYALSSGDLIVRKFKKRSTLGKEGKWEYEVGEDLRPMNADSEHIMESVTNPIATRKDTTKAFQWRIRNLPYPLDVYNITINEEKTAVVVRTTNKKYYKKFSIPDMERAKLPLEQKSLSFAHANNTLIITYQKPPLILEQEKLIRQELAKNKTGDGDLECKPS
ncbi:protein DPCD-like [Actinia tenebrosa]|uniref:Protein DPCD n=1 Tax=Actinia tenebrosa TaxID=6105 RepID=A0A6P8HCQ4_ACTTE|nr:protein DPCD-like [Actinia tenebrosa]